MTKLGENMQREWGADPQAADVWDALQARKKDRDMGNAELKNLAENGSALAMMYLGHDCVKLGGPDEVGLGQQWLQRSAESGSIEGRLQLACHYERQGHNEEARAELEILASGGYSPAMYRLACLIYNNDRSGKAIAQVIAHLEAAVAAGHLPSAGLLSRIYRKERLGLRGQITAYWLHIARIPAAVRCILRYPASDRMRPYGNHFDA